MTYISIKEFSNNIMDILDTIDKLSFRLYGHFIILAIVIKYLELEIKDSKN